MIVIGGDILHRRSYRSASTTLTRLYRSQDTKMKYIETPTNRILQVPPFTRNTTTRHDTQQSIPRDLSLPLAVRVRHPLLSNRGAMSASRASTTGFVVIGIELSSLWACTLLAESNTLGRASYSINSCLGVNVNRRVDFYTPPISGCMHI